MYAALSSAGGAAGRNWSLLVMANGVTSASPGSRPGKLADGVGRHLPGSVLPRYGGNTTPDPSFWRRARIWSATDRPRATPSSSALPSGMVASEATSLAFSAAAWAG